MGYYNITTGWGRAEPGTSPFTDAWFHLLNALRGKWGRNGWIPINDGDAYYWRMTAGVASFGLVAKERGTVTFRLPAFNAEDTVITVAQTTGSVTAVTQNVILSGIGAATLNLTGDVVYISATYETEK